MFSSCPSSCRALNKKTLSGPRRIVAPLASADPSASPASVLVDVVALWAVFKLAVLAAASAAFITAFSTACVCARFQFPQFQPSAKVPPVPLAAVLAAADDAAAASTVESTACAYACRGEHASGFAFTHFEFEPSAKFPLATVLGFWPAPASHVLILSCRGPVISSGHAL